MVWHRTDSLAGQGKPRQDNGPDWAGSVSQSVSPSVYNSGWMGGTNEDGMWILWMEAAARALMRSGVRRDQDHREIEGVEEGGVCEREAKAPRSAVLRTA